MGSLPPTANGLASPLAAQRNSEKPVDLNIRKVILGDILFDPWYPSFYPEELVGREVDRLNVCQWCFKYSKDLVPYLAHIVRKHPISQVFHQANALSTRNHVRESIHLHLVGKSTHEIFTQYTKSTARSTSSLPRTSPSSLSSSSTTSPFSSTSHLSTTTYSYILRRLPLLPRSSDSSAKRR